MTPDDHRQLIEAIDRFSDRADRLLSNSNGGSATIHVNMGGWGIAIAVACALFCLLLVIDMRNDMRDTRRQVERTQDYTNMLWQRYPELRPEQFKQQEKKQ